MGGNPCANAHPNTTRHTLTHTNKSPGTSALEPLCWYKMKFAPLSAICNPILSVLWMPLKVYWTAAEHNSPPSFSRLCC